MSSPLVTIDPEQLTTLGIVKNAQKALEQQIQPHLEYGIELARKSLKDIEPHLPQIIRQFQSIQPFVLGSSKIYFVPPSPAKTPVTQRSDEEVVPAPKKLGKNIVLIAGNSFRYKRQPLRALTLSSKRGQLLWLFFQQPEYFVPDRLSMARFNLGSSDQVRYKVRDLKAAFLRNNLKIIIEKRRHPDGFLLFGIEELPKKQ